MKRTVAYFLILLLTTGTGAEAIHFTSPSHTDNNATILIPLSANPAFNDETLTSGDEIAVFNPRGLCVGAGVWTVSNLTITVWGDDATTTATDGLDAGELYAFRLWDAETNTECDATATYSMGEPVYAPNALVVLASLVGTAETPEPPEPVHFDPVDPTGSSATITIPSTSSPAIDGQPLVTGDEIGVFDPRGLCVGAGVWQEADLTVTAYGDNPATIATDGMVGGDPYAFRIWKSGANTEYDALAAYSAGDTTFASGAEVVLATLINVPDAPEPPELVHFDPVDPTGIKATIRIPFTANPKVDGQPLVAGDEIGVFDPRGLCVGAGVWQEVDLTVTVYGDNSATITTDGMVAGEPYAFRIWKSGGNTEYNALAAYSTGDSTFVPGAEVVLAALNGAAVTPEPAPSTLTEPRVFPNPFKKTTTIVFRNARREQITVSILAITGQCIQVIEPGMLDPGEHTFPFDGSELPPGVYLIRVEAGNEMKTGRALILR
jgi:hypothetical protein